MPATTPESTPAAVVWPFPEVVRMTAHAGSGQWRKRHRGRDFYFGPLDDPVAALMRWKAEWPGITAGTPRRGRAPAGDVTLRQLFTEFMRAKTAKMQRGELVEITLTRYRDLCRRLARALDADHHADNARPSRRVSTLGPPDFHGLLLEWSGYSLTTRANLVRYTREVFGWAEGNLGAPRVEMGTEFRAPRRKAMRRARREQGPRVFTAEQVHALLGAANPTMRAAVLLGLNAGFGNTDLARLRRDSVDLEAGWFAQPREKTEADRMGPLWPETVEAIRGAHKPGDELLLTTRTGSPLVTPLKYDALAEAFDRRLRAKAGLGEGSFYWLRRTFATVAASAPVQRSKDAAKVIMGHTLDEVHDDYVQRFPRELLVGVSEHVRAWLDSHSD